MDTIIWSRVSSISQDNHRQVLNLKHVANEKGWTVKRVFQETVSGTVKTTDRKEFTKLLEYVETNGIKLVMVSEISRIGRRVVDILTTVDTFHKRGIAVYVRKGLVNYILRIPCDLAYLCHQTPSHEQAGSPSPFRRDAPSYRVMAA